MTSEELEELRLLYLARGGQITEPEPVPVQANGLPVIADAAGAAAEIRRRAAAGEGITAMAKAMRHSTRTINALANHYCIEIASSNAASTVERKRRRLAALAPKVQRLANRGMIQVDIAATLGISRFDVRRIAREYEININSRAR